MENRRGKIGQVNGPPISHRPSPIPISRLRAALLVVDVFTDLPHFHRAECVTLPDWSVLTDESEVDKSVTTKSGIRRRRQCFQAATNKTTIVFATCIS